MHPRRAPRRRHLSDTAAHDFGTQRLAKLTLDTVDGGQRGGLDAARQTGRRGKFRDLEVAGLPAQGARTPRVDARLDKGMADTVIARRTRVRPIVVQIIGVGAGKHDAAANASQRGIEMGLAVKAAVVRTGEIGPVAKLAAIEQVQSPALTPRDRLDAPCGLGRHGRRDGVQHRRPFPERPAGEDRQRHAVHPPLTAMRTGASACSSRSRATRVFSGISRIGPMMPEAG